MVFFPQLCIMVDKLQHWREQKLNLPAFDVRFREEENGNVSIFDPLRRKYLVLTPEEWVRVHLVHYLTAYLDYPKSLISLERGLRYHVLQKRFDILVRDRTGAAFLLIECKAPGIPLTQKVVEQVSVYNQKIQAAFLGVSNGNTHICMQRDAGTGKYRQIQHFPDFSS
ncbi:Type I restriction enzyme R protein N terminus (HSDR_N) [Cyclobacterium xiamenense]|uniref:Type I restriction enzyme R protein N terminus (HSDR_N) n=2 Tax=Cyclobacterium xiamenense TaxID=1297121 RepID=A0A1H6YKH8_9BACT|nr:Type I restriction enzyme R protein N terminus (HSDR_N) [Cyclobacterium xiamenense]